jgi:hypothetical protein
MTNTTFTTTLTSAPVTARRVSKHGDFSVATMPSRAGGGFVAWAKVGEIVTTCPIAEPGWVWFEFGTTREEARDKLLTEIGLKGFER